MYFCIAEYLSDMQFPKACSSFQIITGNCSPCVKQVWRTYNIRIEMCVKMDNGKMFNMHPTTETCLRNSFIHELTLDLIILDSRMLHICTVNSEIIACTYYCDFPWKEWNANFCDFIFSCMQLYVNTFKMRVLIMCDVKTVALFAIKTSH